MTGFKDSISNVQKRFHTKVELGDNGTYAFMPLLLWKRGKRNNSLRKDD